MVSSLSVAQTLAHVARRRPPLQSALDVFEPLLSSRADLPDKLAPCLRTAGMTLPVWDRYRAGQGQSLLAGHSLRGADNAIRKAAAKLLPLICALPPFRDCTDNLQALFSWPVRAEENRGTVAEQLMEALLASDEQSFIQLTELAAVPPHLAELPAEFIFSAVLRALTQSLAERPWEEGGTWRHGYCPFCGSFPILAWLDRPVQDEKNAYLAGGGGKKRLYCGMCGTSWHFRRGACPSCEAEGDGAMEILRESGAQWGERLEWCTKCKTYCPMVDLRESIAIPDLDATALGMLHLDMVAHQKGLAPLRASFWNHLALA
ncbi:MAG: formate dehydrogenase accessory protein FdhE [Desulfovibrio sp.]|nr:formate dehydrogenase accessory protein FdhE [Desulfovibrio sp.]